MEKEERKELEFGPGELFSVNEVFDNGSKFLGVYIISKPGEPSSMSLATVNSDGSNLKLLKEAGNLVIFSPRILNGNSLVYFRRLNTGSPNEVWQINLDGTGDQKISDKMGFAQNDMLQSLTLSPDKSEFIVYLGRGLNFFFARTNVNGLNQFIGFPSPALRTHPVWSPITRD